MSLYLHDYDFILGLTVAGLDVAVIARLLQCFGIACWA
jgi:hypothetical protein